MGSTKPDVLEIGTFTAEPTPAPINAPQGVEELLLQADPSNDEIVWWGNRESQPFQLPKGWAISINLDTPSEIWVKAPRKSRVIWMVRKT